MPKISLIIEERAADIGNFMVGRLLPYRQKRSVGPFVFFDHMGPAKLGPGQNLDVLPHPHIGLSTLTYLFEGSIIHRDSLGSVQEINPGDVNWMTAGKGVVHSERTPDSLRNSNKSLHGFQIWVGLPDELEETEPTFHHIPARDIPVWSEFGAVFKLIAGEALGRNSPVPVHSELYLIEIKSSKTTSISLGKRLYGESSIYVLNGHISFDESIFNPGHLLIMKDMDIPHFDLGPDSTVFILGGKAFPHKRYINWNFVSSRRDRLEKAKEDWIEQKFSKIPCESGFVPYPDRKV